MQNKQFDAIYSFGYGCGMARLLQLSHLRITSGPFDWITGASYEYRIELILNDFKGFFDKDDLYMLDKSINDYQPEDPSRHTDTYKNKANDLVFPHDFTEGWNFEEKYPEVMDKYNRRINRFYEFLSDNSKRILLSYISFSQLDEKVIIDSYNKIVKKFGNHISLLIFNHNDNFNHQTIEKKKINDNLVIYSLNNVLYDENGKLKVRANRDLILPCLKKYRIKRTFAQKVKNIIQRFLVKYCFLFIYDKKKRHEYRENFKNKIN